MMIAIHLLLTTMNLIISRRLFIREQSVLRRIILNSILKAMTSSNPSC